MAASLCLVTAGTLAATLAASSFTLTWTHSVEKTEWQEDWRAEEGALVATAARVRGSGAGMEPPPGAVLADGWWHYVPNLPPQPRLALARSRFTDDFRLCVAGACRPLADLAPLPEAPAVTVITSCGG